MAFGVLPIITLHGMALHGLGHGVGDPVTADGDPVMAGDPDGADPHGVGAGLIILVILRHGKLIAPVTAVPVEEIIR